MARLGALVLSFSTFIKSAAFNATYFICCFRFNLIVFTPSTYYTSFFVTRGLAKWQTIGTPPI